MRLLYFSPVYWQSYLQRPHFMIRYFLERGGEKVLWINPYSGRLPRVGDLHRRRVLYEQGTLANKRVRVIDVPGIPAEPLPGGWKLNRLFFWRKAEDEILQFSSENSCSIGIGRPSALAHLVLELFDWRWSFYDAMDDFPEFYSGLSRCAAKRRERRIVESVDQVFVASTYLCNKFREWGVSSKTINNAYNPESIPRNICKPDGEDVFGYIGTIGRWLDWDLTIHLAEMMHNARLLLIGPIFSPPPCNLPKNIELLPPCNHKELGVWLSRFSFGLIPFKKIALTRAVDPIKFYDYRAIGLPVLSTCFGEMSYRGPKDGVFFIDGHGGISQAIYQAKTFRSKTDDREYFRMNNTWTTRFSEARLFDNALAE